MKKLETTLMEQRMQKSQQDLQYQELEEYVQYVENLHLQPNIK